MKLRCNVTNWLPQPAKVVFFFSCFQVELEALPVAQPGLKTMAGADSATKLYLLVRKLVFTCVYYNNGNSFPVFSIPTIGEFYAGPGDDQKGLSLPNGLKPKRQLSIA